MAKKKVAKKKSPATKTDEKSLELTSNFRELSSVKKQLNKAQIKFIKDTVAPTLTSNEIILFLYRANVAKLDPLNGEMYAFASVNKKGERRLTMFAGRDGKRVAGERTGLIDYIQVEPVWVNEERKRVDFWEGGELVGAIAKGKRKDREREYRVSVRFKEYDRGNSIWKSKPETMIKKVAESQLLSMMFPRQLGGVYDSDSEDFTQPTEREVPKIKNGDKPASKEQIKTIKTLGGEIDKKKSISRQQASEYISELSKK